MERSGGAFVSRLPPNWKDAIATAQVAARHRRLSVAPRARNHAELVFGLFTFGQQFAYPPSVHLGNLKPPAFMRKLLADFRHMFELR